MQVSINNPVEATYIFTAIAVAVLFLTARKREEAKGFSKGVTAELKGVAILAVVLSHIGYFLATDNRFLFPLSVLAGVGVSLFLFLSGYGLTYSACKKGARVLQFYRHRLLKIFLPMWLALGVFFLLDFFVLKSHYPGTYIVRSFLGYFPHANLYEDVNSPLWYFTLIVFYYLIFPLVFIRKAPWLSAFIIYLASYLIVKQQPFFIREVYRMYEVHLMAFPLGMLTAYLFYNWGAMKKIIPTGLVEIFKGQGQALRWVKNIFYYVLLAALLFIAGYTALHSGVGKEPLVEELVGLETLAAIVILFLMKPIDFKLLTVLGVYSYEIYLFHWPIMYRYDFLYKFMPGWLATLLYLGLFIILGWLVNRVVKLLAKALRLGD